jgi:sugar O-acyltransferase (sialic acid O-acetyltransferase NeuD family)
MHILIGSKGLAKQALPLFEENPQVVLFDNTEGAEDYLYGHLILHDIRLVEESIKNGEILSFTVCIGAPKWRKHFYELLSKMNAIPSNMISNMSSISKHSNIGDGNLILDYTLIEADSKIGNGNLINSYSGIFHDAEIGDYNEIMPGVKILGTVKIGNRCRIGTGASVLPGIKICDDVIIGAGAVVNRDIIEPGTYVGVPAKRLR